MKCQPVVIIGAPRSGTNMLRNAITSVSGVETWPCDEINYIWRHGNVAYPSDEFTADMANPLVARYVRNQFERIASRYQASRVVEKTCANSLRLEYVNKIVPEARYIVIRRDGIDAAASAMKRWNARVELLYLARKARFVPFTDVPYYAARTAYGLFCRISHNNPRPKYWGPVVSGMREIMAKYTLPEVCILQWKRCLELTERGIGLLDRTRLLEIEYEQFVREPVTEFRRLTDFLELNVASDICNAAISGVDDSSVGKGRKALPRGDKEKMQSLAHDTLAKWGYS